MRTSHTDRTLLAVLGLMLGAAGIAVAASPLTLERTIPLENVSGRIDHLAVDAGGQRLFVAELGNGSVDVIDLHAGRVSGRISSLKEPQGIAYVADQDLIVVANAGDGTVRFFRSADLSPLGTVALGADADNIRIDSATGHIVVGYGEGGLAVIDPTTRTKLEDIKLAGHPESFQIAAHSARAFVNVPDAHQIAVVDRTVGKQVAAWKTPGLGANFPMALDDMSDSIAVAFRSPAVLALVNPASGAMTAKLNTCGDADDVFFDPKRHRIYVSCGAGAIDVVQYGAGGLERIARVETSSGARTSIFVPLLDRLFVAARAGWLGSRAAILVLRPSP